jgi:hypothetical protein
MRVAKKYFYRNSQKRKEQRLPGKVKVAAVVRAERGDLAPVSGGDPLMMLTVALIAQGYEL